MERPYEPYFKVLPSLKLRFSQASELYTSLRDRVRASITRWEWASYPRHELEPFGMWDLGHPQPGRLIKSEPKSKSGKFHHGYDAIDRVVLTEFYGGGEDRFAETYIEYFEDRIESASYDDPIGSIRSSPAPDKRCINVRTLLVSEGRPIAFLSYSDGRHRIAVYEYDQGRITHYSVALQNVAGEPSAHQRTILRGTVVYDGGAVDRIEVRQEGGGPGEATFKDGRRRSLPLVEEKKPFPGTHENPTISPRSAKKEFLLRIEREGHQLAELTPETGIELMLAFYRDERVEGYSRAEDGDMLLYQWGTWNWPKRKPTFYLDITRHLPLTRPVDGNARLLGLTFHFPMTESLRALSESNRWCTAPDELDAFRTFIRDSAASRAVASLKPAKVTLSFCTD
jgi:hypothetical protein